MGGEQIDLWSQIVIGQIAVPLWDNAGSEIGKRRIPLFPF